MADKEKQNNTMKTNDDNSIYK